MNINPYAAPAWPSDYAQRARGMDVAEMQDAMRLASCEGIDYCEALARVRTLNGSQPAANPPPCLPNPAGCLLSEGERYALEQAQDGPPEVIAYADRRGV